MPSNRIKPKRRRFVLMCIDPGLGGTGWAVFNDPQLDPEYTGTEFAKPCGHGVVSVTGSHKADDWGRRAKRISEEINDVYRKYKPDLVIVEWPTTWVGSQISMAATMNGDLMKMAFLIGLLCARVGSNNFQLVTPQEWKGQLPKDVVHRRIKQQTGLKFPEHAADAVGMGLALQRSL